MFIIDQNSCTQCEACVEECPCGAVTLENNTIVHDSQKCMWCGHCLALCPCDAIMIDGDGYSVEDVEDFQFSKRASVAQIRRDIMMRRSVRSFNDTPVTEDELAKILEAAKYAPTAKNCQQNALKVLNDPEEIDQLLEDCMEEIGKASKIVAKDNPEVGAFLMKKYGEFKEEGIDGLFYGAPLVILVFSNSDIDGALCGAAMGEMIEALKLGFCYIQLAAAPMNTPELRAKYNIPEDKHCVFGMAIGNYDANYFSSVPRKPLPLL